ncbi:MAG: FAD-binding protein [Jiangellaceae bacterium]
MASTTSRRSFLIGLAAGAAVVGFDPLSRSWVTEADAADATTVLDVPPLDGELLTDAASRDAAADDFGHIVHRRPFAVLRPGSVDDIVTMVRFANAHLIHVAARGQGHSTFGQPQVEDGLVIDMSTLSAVHHVGTDRAVVDGGAVWSSLLTSALAQGRTPPVLTDYIELSVGGTLSVGGIGGTTHRHGLQVDNVLELQVVTGEGQLVTCSPHRHRRLFDAVLAGLGQSALIVRATVRLVPAAEQARTYLLSYVDLATFTADQRRLVTEERFDYVEGQVLPGAGGGWTFLLEAATFYTPPDVPDDARLLDGLRYEPGSEQIVDQSLFDFQNRLAPAVEFLKSIGVWFHPHPWLNLFLPGSRADGYLADVFAELTPDDLGGGPILLYPFLRARLTKPLARVPDEPVVFLLGLLRTAPPDDPQVVDEMITGNRDLFEQARRIGGKQYPIGSIPFSRSDWARHFAPEFGRLAAAKALDDPRRILTPGQGIFPTRG